MDFGCRGSSAVGNNGEEETGPGSQRSEGLKRKLRDLEASMKVMKDAVDKEKAEKSGKICRLMQDNVRLEQTVQRLENSLLQGLTRPMARPKPFALFPEEVWEAIIEEMDLSSDLQMLGLALPQLEPLVKKGKKTIFLFENVLPLVCKHLDRRDINKCRLVCQKWNQDLCTLVANCKAPDLRSNEATSKPPVPHCQLPYNMTNAYCFYNNGQLQKFLKKMVDHPRNPIFGRFLCLKLDERYDLKDFWECVLELVKKFGEYVWNLEIKCFWGGHDSIAFYETLQETLGYLPNLRYLAVQYNYPYGPCTTNMAAQLWSPPLPPLSYLQSLELDLRGETGMISAFSPYFSKQIHRMESWEILSNMNFKDAPLHGLISLEYLKVGLTSREEIFQLLKFPSPKLSKLCLDSKDNPFFFQDYHPGPPVSITLGQLGNLLEKFSRLEHLEIFCRVEPSSSLGPRLQFSRLKTLEIAVGVDEYDLQHNLDFLLWFPLLKHLVILKKYTAKTNLNVNKIDEHSTLKIRNHLYTNQMLDSNVWELIPSLELLEVWGYGKYTRKMFENRVG